MAGSDARAPDALILGGGGVLGEAWMNAVLAGIEEAGGFDARACPAFVGTSAGSIVAAILAGGVHPRARLGRIAADPAAAQSQAQTRRSPVGHLQGVLAAAAATSMAPLGAVALSATEPAGALLRRVLLARAPAGRRPLAELGRAVQRLGVEWDGRLRIAAVELETGRRVIFGAKRPPRVSVAEAVQASCAIPGVFQPLRRDGRSYVDGGAWSPTNMDAAPVARGARVLCLNPTGSLRARLPELTGALGAVSRSIAAAEAFALRLRGARVTVVNPDRASAGAMGVNLLDPRRRAAVIAAGLQQGAHLARSR